jgi:hypothetical protein
VAKELTENMAIPDNSLEHGSKDDTLDVIEKLIVRIHDSVRILNE